MFKCFIKQTFIKPGGIELNEKKSGFALPPDEELYDIFGDSTRIKILFALLPGELCVSDLAQCLGVTQTACSHQLRVLKNNKLVRFRRDGKQIYYSLSDDHIRTILEIGMEHINE